MPAGRPSDYDPENTPRQAKKACLMGATDADLADFFGVSETTINNWKLAHPKFLESIKEGKQQADADVAKSLFERATGYSHPEDKIFNDGGKPMIVPTVKHYPPDTTAGIFWLKNRQSDKWRDRKHTEISGPNGGPVQWNILPVTTLDNVDEADG